MKQEIFAIESNVRIAKNTMEMVLSGDTSGISAPGQFVNIKLEGFYLRRPISVCDYDKDRLTLVYKIVGHGTEKMSHMKKGEVLDMLTGLGNGFNMSICGSSPLLIGGGAGVPPMYNLCRKLAEQGKKVSVVLGFNRCDEIFYESKFRDIGATVSVTTADGSCGKKGFVTDVIDEIEYTYFYACGPEPMLRAVYDKTCTEGQMSFEERMGCGFGACMGCSCKTAYGYRRICKDGPVLKKEEIVW